MATSTKRHWKLQEIVAHGANVNCASLGKKSGRVLVTGGDDKNVNLWAVDKPTCLMSLSGHTTPVECVRFAQAEDRVCGGSLSGALKIWDLEQAKIVRTLTGHKANIRCMDFHPYGEFLASGSVDTNIKLWDVRRKGCIFTYKGHKHNVNSLEFSPDGRWIASGGEDGVVKLWDLPAGKMLAEFTGHSAPVNVVHFHPHEFLLASGSSDKSVKFWDLESFQLVSTTDGDSTPVRTIHFNADGLCLYCGSQDVLRVYGWEPARIHDYEETHWGKVADISTTNSHLVGVSFRLTQVFVFAVDLRRVRPFKREASQQGGTRIPESQPFQSGTPMRKSFTRRLPSLNTKNTTLPFKMAEDSESSTPDIDTEMDASALKYIQEPEDYEAVFQPRRQKRSAIMPLTDQRMDTLRRPVQKPDQQKPEMAKKAEVAKYEPQRPTGSPQHRPLRRSPTLEIYYKAEKQETMTTTTTTVGGPRQQQTSYQDPMQAYQVKQYAGGRRTEVAESVQPPAEAVPLPTFKDVPRGDPQPSTVPLGGPLLVARPQTYQMKQQQYGGGGPRGGSTTVGSVQPVPAVPVPAIVPPYANVLRVDPEFPPPLSVLHGPTTITTTATQSPSKRLDRVAADIMKVKSSDLAVEEFGTSKLEKLEVEDFIPAQMHCSVGLDVDEFLPLSAKLNSSLHLGGGQQHPEMSEAEAVSSILKGHDSMIQVLANRTRNVEIIHTLWANKDLKTAVEAAVHLSDLAVIVDILNGICLKPSIWNLDVCVASLPSIYELLQSKYETYMTTGCSALRIVLKNFSGLIRSNIAAPPGMANDLAREERYNKCMSCYNHLMSIRAFILKRQTLQGKLGQSFRELHTLLQALD